MNDASLLIQAAFLQESRVVIVIAGMAGAAFRGGRSHAGPGVLPRADRRRLWPMAELPRFRVCSTESCSPGAGSKSNARRQKSGRTPGPK